MEKFITDVFSHCGIHLTSSQVKLFTTYESELLTWNEKFNLTAIRDPEGIRTKHFLDSLSILVELKTPAPLRLIDVGTGAGFPGIPLKILLPSMHLTLVESVGKKHLFAVILLSSCSLIMLR